MAITSTFREYDYLNALSTAPNYPFILCNSTTIVETQYCGTTIDTEWKVMNTNKKRWERKKEKNFCKRDPIFRQFKSIFKKKIRKMSNRGK